MQPIYKEMVNEGKIPIQNLPITEKAYDTILSIPIFPELQIEQAIFVSKKIKEFYGV